MNIALAIKYMYPNAKTPQDFEVIDLNNGEPAFISEWNLSEPQPTEAELQAAWEQLQTLPPSQEPSTSKQLTSEQLESVNAMLALELAQVKIKINQQEQANADLLLSLVKNGVI